MSADEERNERTCSLFNDDCVLEAATQSLQFVWNCAIIELKVEPGFDGKSATAPQFEVQPHGVTIVDLKSDPM
jgi:hypothetical protein